AAAPRGAVPDAAVAAGREVALLEVEELPARDIEYRELDDRVSRQPEVDARVAGRIRAQAQEHLGGRPTRDRVVVDVGDVRVGARVDLERSEVQVQDAGHVHDVAVGGREGHALAGEVNRNRVRAGRIRPDHVEVRARGPRNVPV